MDNDMEGKEKSGGMVVGRYIPMWVAPVKGGPLEMRLCKSCGHDIFRVLNLEPLVTECVGCGRVDREEPITEIPEGGIIVENLDDDDSSGN